MVKFGNFFANLNFEFWRASRLREFCALARAPTPFAEIQRVAKGAKSVKSFDLCKYAGVYVCVKISAKLISGVRILLGRGFGLGNLKDWRD